VGGATWDLEESSFHSRPFGLSNVSIIAPVLVVSKEKVYLSVKSCLARTSEAGNLIEDEEEHEGTKAAEG
jgi:hypothetical protein